MRAVVKIGSSSVTTEQGDFADAALGRLADQLAEATRDGHQLVLVCSGAIAAGLRALGVDRRPGDVATLQAAAAVGQPRLMERCTTLLSERGLVAGQVLLTPHDFGQRSQYLHARHTLGRLLDLGVLPIVNENDTVADDEIRYGDNDRLAALVSHLIGADVLVLLTDTDGVFTADPRLDEEASLIEEIVEVDAALEAVAGGVGTERGSGGMASKLAAAKIAAWSGVRAVISAADTPGVVLDAIYDQPTGTRVRARPDRLASRKVWIAFALGAAGRVVVDAGARRALADDHRSLLPAGVRAVEGRFEPDDAVEVVSDDGVVFAKGLVRYDSETLARVAGRRTTDLPDGAPHEVIHRDDLVLLA